MTAKAAINPVDTPVDQINSYQKITKTGRTVAVRNYERTSEQQRKQNIGKYVFLGRPAIAATPGRFGQNRTAPGIWPSAPVGTTTGTNDQPTN